MGLFGLFGKKEPDNATVPANDVEKWLVATYAPWSESAEGNWRYIAGSTEKSKQEGASMRVMLRRDWDVSNKAALLDMVSFLIAVYEGGECESEEIQTGAWNLCRACQILAMGYVGGYIEREEMVQESVKVGRLMQKYYHSWNELYESYLAGYKKWRITAGGDAQKDMADREDLCKKLLEMQDGPCVVDWKILL